MTAPADAFVTAFEIAHTGDEADEAVRAEAKAALERARATRDAQVLASLAPATLAAYARDWRAFVLWCARHAVADPSLVPLPASDATLSTWVGSQDALRPSSLRRRLAAVRLVHRWAAEPLVDARIPLTLAAVKGHVRRHAGVSPRQVRAATGDLVWRLADACDGSTPAGLRNRALILVGFDAALRSAELVGLDHGHLTWSAESVALTLPRSKADQRGQGAVVSVHARLDSPWCPVAALRRWVEASGRATGAVFVALQRGGGHGEGPIGRLSPRTVARIVRAAAERAGLASSELNEFSSHSLRRGLITTALDAGAAVDDVMRHARHGTVQSTLRYRETRDAVGRQPRVAIGPQDKRSHGVQSLVEENRPMKCR